MLWKSRWFDYSFICKCQLFNVLFTKHLKVRPRRLGSAATANTTFSNLFSVHLGRKPYEHFLLQSLFVNRIQKDTRSPGSERPWPWVQRGRIEIFFARMFFIHMLAHAGNTALTYACCGGYEDVVRLLVDAGAELECHNENGHTPLMEAASGGHVGVAAILLDRGAGINTHSNEFKESALTLACYKGTSGLSCMLVCSGTARCLRDPCALLCCTTGCNLAVRMVWLVTLYAQHTIKCWSSVCSKKSLSLKKRKSARNHFKLAQPKLIYVCNIRRGQVPLNVDELKSSNDLWRQSEARIFKTEVNLKCSLNCWKPKCCIFLKRCVPPMLQAPKKLGSCLGSEFAKMLGCLRTNSPHFLYGFDEFKVWHDKL